MDLPRSTSSAVGRVPVTAVTVRLGAEGEEGAREGGMREELRDRLRQ